MPSSKIDTEVNLTGKLGTCLGEAIQKGENIMDKANLKKNLRRF